MWVKNAQCCTFSLGLVKFRKLAFFAARSHFACGMARCVHIACQSIGTSIKLHLLHSCTRARNQVQWLIMAASWCICKHCSAIWRILCQNAAKSLHFCTLHMHCIELRSHKTQCDALAIDTSRLRSLQTGCICEQNLTTKCVHFGRMLCAQIVRLRFKNVPNVCQALHRRARRHFSPCARTASRCARAIVPKWLIFRARVFG